MKRIVARLVLAVALVGAGWTIGRAQASVPNFELQIDAPAGQTNVTCLRGCELAWIERMTPGSVDPGGQKTFTYRCSGGGPDQRCASGRVGGWIRP